MNDAKAPSDILRLGAAGCPLRLGDETTRLGKQIYEQDIRSQVEDSFDGRIVAIDVDSAPPPLNTLP